MQESPNAFVAGGKKNHIYFLYDKPYIQITTNLTLNNNYHVIENEIHLSRYFQIITSK